MLKTLLIIYFLAGDHSNQITTDYQCKELKKRIEYSAKELGVQKVECIDIPLPQPKP